ncbi:MAG: amidohydrolase [Bacillota bacterium]|nr:amidohydrolase [Bacillota bacterium]
MLLIKNGKIFTMSDGILEGGSILIDKGKIVQISEEINSAADEIIDAVGAWVTPGFVEAHCHIGIHQQDIGGEGVDINEATDPVTPHLRAIDGINPMDTAFLDAVKAGITTVMTGPGSANVIGGQFVAMKTSGKCIDEMAILEPAALKIALGENPKRVYKGKNRMPSTRMATAALLRETLIRAKNYKAKKELALSKGDNFDIDIRMEAMIPVLDKNIPLKAHAHRADDILTAIRIAKEFDVRLTIDHCSEGHLIPEYIKEAGYPVIIGPTMTARSKVELKNKSFETYEQLHKFGVKFAIMTDHPVMPIQYLPICAGLASKYVLDVEEALKTITINAAEICGVDDRIGSIEVGKDADIAIFSGNPMELASETLYTIIDGEIRYRRN